ncbi:CDP-alcohol phosphatidyltransferase-domain-containing protein [Amylocarpus encephaloides]|uniref:CDP-alcohol phosphatidyltransferase-domain-containing protein n=1 Tax=Amylocarpus encephaloides TaxID=45428 RepID=A0A9P7YTE8_9HELO|nr:CDP-alcohol phosphatidyltransferase-domain-containing protein [Amylocarpus encephaloides]
MAMVRPLRPGPGVWKTALSTPSGAHYSHSCPASRSGVSTVTRAQQLIAWAPSRCFGPSLARTQRRITGKMAWFSTTPRVWSGPEPSPHRPPSPPKKPLLEALRQLTPHENIYTVPNILTATRLVAAPVVGYLVLHDCHAWAVGLFAYAGMTDLVDGWIARRWKLQTVVGTVIDPMADKTLMTILTVCLAVKGALPVWLAVIILGRDVALAISAIWWRWISLPPPKTFMRYWDFSLPSAEVRPTTISKYNTALQLALIGATTAQPLLGTAIMGVDVVAVMTGAQYLVATTTVWSGLSYIYTKDAIKIIGQEGKDSKQPPPPP